MSISIDILIPPSKEHCLEYYRKSKINKILHPSLEKSFSSMGKLSIQTSIQQRGLACGGCDGFSSFSNVNAIWSRGM